MRNSFDCRFMFIEDLMALQLLRSIANTRRIHNSVCAHYPFDPAPLDISHTYESYTLLGCPSDDALRGHEVLVGRGGGSLIAATKMSCTSKSGTPPWGLVGQCFGGAPDQNEGFAVTGNRPPEDVKPETLDNGCTGFSFAQMAKRMPLPSRDGALWELQAGSAKDVRTEQEIPTATRDIVVEFHSASQAVSVVPFPPVGQSAAPTAKSAALADSNSPKAKAVTKGAASVVLDYFLLPKSIGAKRVSLDEHDHAPTVVQQTLRTPITSVGIGIHTGAKCKMTFFPAPVGTGIIFRRVNVDATIPARFDYVVNTHLRTVLGIPDRPEATIDTVEHVMAALYGCGITNAIVEVDGPELPVHDGSAKGFVFLIDSAGVEPQNAVAPLIVVHKLVRVQEGDAFVEIRPSSAGLVISMAIDFAQSAIGRQSLSLRITSESFRKSLITARTFGCAADVSAMQAMGLARGGSLDNALIVDGPRILNPAGLRTSDEFVRHKIVDAVGDLALCGARLQGHVVAHKSGHSLNNRVLRALFAKDDNWELVGDMGPEKSWGAAFSAPLVKGYAGG